VYYDYKYNGKEYQEDFGLNMTAMDYRQYDNALGRFNSIDALAELMPSITPYHFGFNNPVYWGDPSGLTPSSGQSALEIANALFENSGSGRTDWVNDGDGFWSITASSGGGGGFYDSNSGVFTHSVLLDEIVISKDVYIGSERFFNILRGQTYWKSPFYKGWRSMEFSRQMDQFQNGLDWLGTIDPTGIVDATNAIGYLVRGQGGNAAIAAIAILPFGDLAKGTKLADKAHTVYTGVKDGLPYVGITSDLSKRYTAEEMAKYKIKGFLENVPGRNMARGIEQNLINYHGLENMANKINSISPANQEGKHSGTMERATQYLNSNLPGWNN
jgi:RHS repeat-associated protein